MTDWLIKLYFSTVKILAHRPTHISVVATVLLITQRERERERERERWGAGEGFKSQSVEECQAFPCLSH